MLTSYGEEQTKVIALFRQCTMKDFSVLQSFSRKTFFETFADVNTTENMTAYLDKAFAPEKLRMELSDTAAAFYFLYWNGSLAGYLKLNEAAAQTDIHDEQSLEIERIYVCKDFQGAGLQRFSRRGRFTKDPTLSDEQNEAALRMLLANLALLSHEPDEP